MHSTRALELLARQRGLIPALRRAPSDAPEFDKWYRDTEVAIEKIFGKTSRNSEDFKAISFSLNVWTTSTPDSAWHEAHVRGLDRADAVISSMEDEIREYGFDDEDGTAAPDVLSLIERICLRFFSVAQQLQHRHSDRDTITIEDEYDVQDLMHALLRLHFDDVRAEETTPSYAGAASRVDFLLKAEKIVIEVKKTRPSMKPRDLGEQLIIDRARYESHPDCETLVCFVYDPEGRIGNPVGIERDLEARGSGLRVRVIIAPKR